MERIVYGTSDSRLNLGEVWLTIIVAEAYKKNPLFFYYPRGKEWDEFERELFRPYEPLPPNPKEALNEAELPEIEMMALQEMAKGLNLTMKEAAEIIREHREIKSFRAISFPPQLSQRPVYVSSKNKLWVKEWSKKKVEEVLNNPRVKIGGAFIYFIYGIFLATHKEFLGILPRKLKADVFGAFQAGEEFAGKKAQRIETGEIDFMTASQWQSWERDHIWRKAPAFAVKKLLSSPFKERVKSRLLAGKYCPIAYDEERGEFYFWKEE